MRVFKWIFLVAILGLWGVGTVWAEKEKEEAVEEEAAEERKMKKMKKMKKTRTKTPNLRK